MDDVIIQLNVGGFLYTTWRTTLIRYPGSRLAGIGELKHVQDTNGAFFIDRDGPIFRHVLNFLRHGRLILPEDFKEWDLLYSEARHYNVNPLAEAVKKEAKCRRVGSEEFIQLSVVPEKKYTYIGNSSTLENITMLANFFYGVTGRMPDFTSNVQVTYTVNIPSDTAKPLHKCDEEAIIKEIKNLGFQAKKQSRTKNAKTKEVEEWGWTFSKRISG